jgi:prepilin-type N-terminal cleavage/methylation domain-containing protein/prepilin-type processing-associated H-X9-DG protein
MTSISRFKTRGFSLIELIVVVGIIAILIALLFPSLMRVRHQARTLVCLSNLRQIGLATVMYRNDHAGRWFACGGWDYDEQGRQRTTFTYDMLLMRYLSNSARTFACPDDSVQRSAAAGVRSYSLNDRMYNPSVEVEHQAIPAGAIPRPTETIVLSEHFVEGNALRSPAYHVLGGPVDGAGRSNFYYHNANRMSNVLWFDGHASSLRPSDLRQRAYGVPDQGHIEDPDWVEYRWTK